MGSTAADRLLAALGVIEAKCAEDGVAHLSALTTQIVVDDARAVCKELRLLRAAARAALAQDDPWSLRMVLARLASATVHSLEAHDCDRHGHEGDRYALRRVEELQGRLAALQQVLA